MGWDRVGQSNTPCGFFENVFSRERVKAYFFAALNIIISTPFLQISLKFLKSFRTYENFLLQY